MAVARVGPPHDMRASRSAQRAEVCPTSARIAIPRKCFGHIARRALANLHNLLRSDTSTEASAWKVPNGHIRALAGPDATAMPGPATLNSSNP